MDFTEAQLQAIAHKDGPCLVLAVPGAGKTTVLLERLHQLIESGVPARSIASITFSRRQAEDMKQRFETRYGSANGLTFSTIHAFCYRILQGVAREAGEPLQLLEGMQSGGKYHILQSLARQNHFRPLSEEELEEFFRIDGFLKNSLLTYQEYIKSTALRFPHFEVLQKAYTQYKQENHLIDFDDMLLRTLQILDRDPERLSRLRERFHYFQIDEAQDTSLIQLRIIRLLAAPRNNLFFVADDDQAIYSFRGANPRYLLAFQEAFPQGKQILMQDNYRSSRNIVKLAAGLIQHNHARYEKTPTTDWRSEEKTQVILTETLHQQTKRLVEELKEEKAESIAVLYRNNYSALPLADALDRAGIPFRLRSDAEKYLRHPIVRDVRAFFSLANDPTDAESFARIYYKMNQYLKKDFAQEVLACRPTLSVWERLHQLSGTQNTFYREKLEFLEEEFELIANLSPEGAIQEMQNHLGYGVYLNEHARRNNQSIRTDQRIMEWLEESASYCRTNAEFLIRLDRLSEILKQAGSREASLVLSTVHGAKGLEYDTVWLIDLMQGEFPSSLALEMNSSAAEEFMEEERRLFYVGITRARNKLRLFGRHVVNGRKVSHSQFLDELAGRRKKK